MTQIWKMNYMNGDQVILKLRHKQTGTNDGASNVIVNTNKNEQLTKINLACIKISHLNINGLRNKIDLLNQNCMIMIKFVYLKPKFLTL